MKKFPPWLAIPLTTALLLTGVVAGANADMPTSPATTTATVATDVASKVAADTVVTPIAPTMNTDVGCDVLAMPTIPVVEGIFYMVDWNYSARPITATVTAIPEDGYTIADGATTEWVFDQPWLVSCPTIVTPLAPRIVPAATCGVEATVEARFMNPVEPTSGYIGVTSEGVLYKQTKNRNRVTVTASPKPSYIFQEGSVSTWNFKLPAVEPCP